MQAVTLTKGVPVKLSKDDSTSLPTGDLPFNVS